MQSQPYPDGGCLSMIFSSNYEPAGRYYRFLISRSVLYPLYSAYHAPKPPSSESEESVTVRAGAREMVRGDETTPLEHYDLVDKIDNDRDDEGSTYIFPPVLQDVSPVHAIGEDEPKYSGRLARASCTPARMARRIAAIGWRMRRIFID